MDSEAQVPHPDILLPRPPSKKWVTFDSFLDDALESGKLNKIQDPRRRDSVSGSTLSSSVSSLGSLEYAMEVNPHAGDGTKKGLLHHFPGLAHTRGGFSQSLGSTGSSVEEDPGSSRDKYSVFSSISTTPRQASTTGWSQQVLLGPTGKCGWSEEVLGMEDVNQSYGIGPLRIANQLTGSPPTLDLSPNRSFVRDFP